MHPLIGLGIITTEFCDKNTDENLKKKHLPIWRVSLTVDKLISEYIFKINPS